MNGLKDNHQGEYRQKFEKIEIIVPCIVAFGLLFLFSMGWLYINYNLVFYAVIWIVMVLVFYKICKILLDFWF